MTVCRTGAGSARPGRLDDDAVEAHDLAAARAASRRSSIVSIRFAADGAAQAARGHLDDVVVGLFDEQMIEADLAELVDDDRGGGKHRDP